jgi:hypothetical protein
VERLREIPGSKDQNLLAAVSEYTGFFRMIDELAERRDDDEEKPPRCAEAVRQIINGERYDSRFGYVYGYAYEALCQAIGTETKQSWTGIARSSAWFPEIAKGLERLHIPLKIPDLLNRGPLIELPEPDDFPGLGWWTADEVARAASVFNGLDMQRLDPTTAQEIRPVADAIEDIRSWIMVAAERLGDWLVGIHS